MQELFLDPYDLMDSYQIVKVNVEFPPILGIGIEEEVFELFVSRDDVEP